MSETVTTDNLETIGVNVETLPKYAQLILKTHILNPPFPFEVKETIVLEFFNHVNYHTPKSTKPFTLKEKLSYLPHNEYVWEFRLLKTEITKLDKSGVDEAHYQIYAKNVDQVFDILFQTVMDSVGLSGTQVPTEQEIM